MQVSKATSLPSNCVSAETACNQLAIRERFDGAYVSKDISSRRNKPTVSRTDDITSHIPLTVHPYGVRPLRDRYDQIHELRLDAVEASVDRGTA